MTENFRDLIVNCDSARNLLVIVETVTSSHFMSVSLFVSQFSLYTGVY